MTSRHHKGMVDFAKQRIALRYWLLGRDYTRACLAMDVAESYHSGTRRGGAPEFSHQVAIASALRTQVSVLRHPEDTIIAALCHDVREDYDVSDEEVRLLGGDRVADAVAAMTKEFRSVRRPESEVFDAIAHDPIASVVKGFDRIHNHSTMVGVFSPEKMAEYVEETHRLFRPMLRAARHRFPDQEPVYELLGLMLDNQLSLLEEILHPH